MGYESKNIPCIDFSKNPKDLEEGSEGYEKLCDEVIEALENYGFFQVVYDKVPVKLHEEMVMASKDLFDLPIETKVKNVSSKPYMGYVAMLDVLPLFESQGIEDAHSLDQARAFTDLMWPEYGNPSFCQTLNCMSKKMVELERIIRKMILKSLGVENYYDSHVENSFTLFRFQNYKAPHSSNSIIGLPAHTDKNILSVLYQDLQGLQILSNEGDWFQVAPQEATFTVFVGEALKAWSNGRLHAVRHRVMMTGQKERHSYAVFSIPKEGVVVEVPKELVDKDHPLLFRPFDYLEFLRFSDVNLDIAFDATIEAFAGTCKLKSIPKLIN